jgi:hypothetical protein
MLPTTSRRLAERLEKHENFAARTARKQEPKMANKPAFETITIAENAVIEVARDHESGDFMARLMIDGEFNAQITGNPRWGYTFRATKTARNGETIIDYVWGKSYKTTGGALKYMERRATNTLEHRKAQRAAESDVQS